jgi:hypothetical protein
LTEIIDRLLAKNKEERFQSAEEVADVLGKYLVHVQNPALEVSLPERIGPRKPSQPASSGYRRLTWGAGLALARWGAVITATEFTGRTLFFLTKSSVVRRGASENPKPLIPPPGIASAPPTNVSIFIFPADIRVTLKGSQKQIAWEGIGLKTAHLPPGTYELSAASTVDGKEFRQGDVRIDGRGTRHFTVFALDQPPPREPPIELYGRTGAIQRMVFSNDGGWLASASNDGSTRVWKPKGPTWEEHARQTHTNSLTDQGLARGTLDSSRPFDDA